MKALANFLFAVFISAALIYIFYRFDYIRFHQSLTRSEVALIFFEEGTDWKYYYVAKKSLTSDEINILYPHGGPNKKVDGILFVNGGILSGENIKTKDFGYNKNKYFVPQKEVVSVYEVEGVIVGLPCGGGSP